MIGERGNAIWRNRKAVKRKIKKWWCRLLFPPERHFASNFSFSIFRSREKSFNFFAAFNPSSSSSSGQAWAISCYHRRRCHILPVILALSLSLSSKLSLSLSISHANTFSPSLSHAHNVSLSFTCMLDALSVFLKKASRDCWTPF